MPHSFDFQQTTLYIHNYAVSAAKSNAAFFENVLIFQTILLDLLWAKANNVPASDKLHDRIEILSYKIAAYAHSKYIILKWVLQMQRSEPQAYKIYL